MRRKTNRRRCFRGARGPYRRGEATSCSRFGYRSRAVSERDSAPHRVPNGHVATALLCCKHGADIQQATTGLGLNAYSLARNNDHLLLACWLARIRAQLDTPSRGAALRVSGLKEARRERTGAAAGLAPRQGTSAGLRLSRRPAAAASKRRAAATSTQANEARPPPAEGPLLARPQVLLGRSVRRRPRTPRT